MNSRGFILLEFLVAILLFSLTGSMLWMGVTQGIKAEKRAQGSFKTYDPLRLAFLRLDQDLRNAVFLRDYPFEGKDKEIKFPMRKGDKLYLIRYYLKNKDLVRSEQELTVKLKDSKVNERILVRDMKDFEFTFPFEDEEGRRAFKSFWLREPYYGIPKAVKVKISIPFLDLDKLIAIPQGKIGFIQDAA